MSEDTPSHQRSRRASALFLPQSAELLWQAPIGVFTSTLAGRYIYANPAMARIYGYSTPEEMVSSVTDIASQVYANPADRQTLLRRLAEEGELINHQARHRHRDGHEVWISQNLQAVFDEKGEISFLQGFNTDCTAQRAAERAQIDNEARFDLALRIARIGYWRYDCSSQKVEWSSGHDALFGIPLHSFRDNPVAVKECVHPDDQVSGLINLRRTLEKDLPYDTTYRVIHPDRTERWLHSYGILYRDEDGKPDYIFGITQDITETKHAEMILRESEERFRLLFNQVETVSIQGYRMDGTVIYWNEGSRILYGYTPEEAVGKTLFDLIIPQEMQAEVRLAVRDMAHSGEPIPSSELELQRKDGSRVRVYSSHCILQRAGRPAELYCIDIDLTEIKIAEEERERLRAELHQAQKMESVGRLAGGVAHDFNNMLGVILGYAELLLLRTTDDSAQRPALQGIREAAQRSAELTRQLLAFARKQTVAPQVIDLNLVVGKMLKMLQRLIGENIELLWEPGENLGPVKIDSSQVDQILANLAVNSRDAILGTGTLTIRTDNFTLDRETSKKFAGSLPGEYVRLTVEDNGCGMERPTLTRLFEPFFTTKETGKGTGLGLAMVYGIVKQSEGFIHARSQPDRGTVMEIYLPRHVQAAAEVTPVVPTIPKTCGRNMVVLLVEDEPLHLAVTRTMLEHKGYHVLAAHGPAEAVVVAREFSGRIDLLLTDVVMPKTNGRDLARQLTASRPELRTLFMSGYTADVIAHHGVLEEGIHYVQKPFSIDYLALKISQTLS